MAWHGRFIAGTPWAHGWMPIRTSSTRTQYPSHLSLLTLWFATFLLCFCTDWATGAWLFQTSITPHCQKGWYTAPTWSQGRFKNRKLRSSSSVYLNLFYKESIFQDALISFRFCFLVSLAAPELLKSGCHMLACPASHPDPKVLFLVLNRTEHLPLAPDISWPEQTGQS